MEFEAHLGFVFFLFCVSIFFSFPFLFYFILFANVREALALPNIFLDESKASPIVEVWKSIFFLGGVSTKVQFSF
jgi:hypothetical protein